MGILAEYFLTVEMYFSREYICGKLFLLKVLFWRKSDNYEVCSGPVLHTQVLRLTQKVLKLVGDSDKVLHW